MTNDLRWMLSSDQQFPYQDNKMIKLWFEVMKWFKPNVVDILGDTDDQACYSKYTEGKSAEFLKMYKDQNGAAIVPLMQHEAKGAREFYEMNREIAGTEAELFTALGNHDIRIFNYMDAKLPEFLNIVTPEALWKLDSLGYKYIYYDALPEKRYGDIHVHHGISIADTGAVRADMNNLQVSLIRGHSHRLAAHFQTYELRNKGKGETIRGYEIGHMCDPRSSGMKYMQHHDWQKGFAIAHIENGKTPHIQLIEVSNDYSCVVDGKLFKL